MVDKPIILYHRVFKNENFEKAVASLVKLVWNSQKSFPNKARHLILEIDWHKKKDSSFNIDMAEFVYDFVLDVNKRNPIEGGFKRFFSTWDVALDTGKICGETPEQDNSPPEIVDVIEGQVY